MTKIINDYIVINDDKTGEVAFSIMSESIENIAIDECFAWTNAKYQKENTLFLLDQSNTEKVKFENVPKESILSIIKTQKIFLTTIENDKIKDYYILQAHKLLEL